MLDDNRMIFHIELFITIIIYNYIKKSKFINITLIILIEVYCT